MSSGNPFRASLLHDPAASSPVPQTSFVTEDSVPEASEDGRPGLESSIAAPLKTKKQVRIESNTTFIPHPDASDAHDSPHPPLIQRSNNSEHVNPSPAITSASLPSTDLLVGQLNVHSAGQGNGTATTDMSTGLRSRYQAPQSSISPGGIPANPFARTLASIEPQERDSAADRTAAERPALGNNRASLDVESFKTLLMTGKPGPRQSGLPKSIAAVPSPLNAPQFESSSNTDTSSMSRQSISEPPHEIHPESPRTSYEMAESDEDEKTRLVAEGKKGKKQPPPAPKHRHGKLVTQRQPQTVSFESFSASEPPPLPMARLTDDSDINKPLPPTPIVSAPSLHISTQDTTPPRPKPMQQYSNESLMISNAPVTQKRTPPPVPLARRQSQLRNSSTGNRSRSNSSLAGSSQLLVDAGLQSPNLSNKDPLFVAKSPPPPPRSRHGARLTDIGSSSANSSSTELPQRSSSVRTAGSALDATTSRRNTLDSEPASPAASIRRTSSISSTRNTPRVVSNESNGSNMPPPPPPPRRRQSNRSSLDQQRPQTSSSPPIESRRTSMDNRRTSLDNHRRTSVASERSLRREYVPADEKGGSEYALSSPNEESEDRLGSGAQTRTDSTNILDDMDKFQREIEELRLRYTKVD